MASVREYQKIKKDETFEIDEIIIGSIDKNDIDSIDRIISEITSQEKMNQDMLTRFLNVAVEGDSIYMVEKMIENNLIGGANKTHTVSWAIRNENREMLELLISAYELDKEFDENEIPNNDNSSEKSDDDHLVRVYPLCVYKETDKTMEMLEIFLPHSYPKGFGSLPLYEAVSNNHRKSIDLLFDLSDVEKVKRKIIEIVNSGHGDAWLNREGVDYFFSKIRKREVEMKRENIDSEIKKDGRKLKSKAGKKI